MTNRVRLLPTAREAFPDIGTRHGTILRRAGQWVIVSWDGSDATTWIQAASVEDAT